MFTNRIFTLDHPIQYQTFLIFRLLDGLYALVMDGARI